MLRNTTDRFGLITRALHWGIAGLIVVQLPLGLRLSDMQPGLANLWLYSAHKTLGLSIFALVALRIVWHIISPPPAPMGGGWQARMAKAVHWAIYGMMVAIPLSGWVASSATGIDILLFDRIPVPAIAPVSAQWEATAFAIHDIATKLLMALLAIHIGAAFKREIDGDGTLTRMLRGHR